jgi:hypothetical protein
MDPFKALPVVARSTSANFFFGFGTLSCSKSLGVRIAGRFSLYRITAAHGASRDPPTGITAVDVTPLLRDSGVEL